MSVNTRQTMIERTYYSLKDFEYYFDSEILRLYHGQVTPNQQSQQLQRQNLGQQQATRQNIASQQGQKQQQSPKQNQIRQKNVQ